VDEPIPIIFCIDVEPDEHTFPIDAPSPWSGFEALTEASIELRARLTDLTGQPARFTWSLRIDPQVADAYGDPAWVVDHRRAFFDDALEHGDSLGIHPHAWRWDRDRRVWIADHEDAAWVDHCVEMAFEGYRSRFDAVPSHHRFGGRFLSERVLATAERLGMRYDLTMEPGEEGQGPGERYSGVWTGNLPDFRSVPRMPFHPDASNFRRPATDGTSAMWAIPMSSGRISRDRVLLDRLKHPIRSARGVARRVRAVTDRARSPYPAGAPPGGSQLLRLWDAHPDRIWDAAFASLAEIAHPYLAFGLRSDMQREVIRALESLAVRPEARKVVFTTPEDTLERLGLIPESPRTSARPRTE
jgi:hypothetical protein